MKVLITIGEKQFPNPFVRLLANSIRRQGTEVVCSSKEFWDNWEEYDIIHIQWPETLLKKSMTSIEELELHLQKIKQAGKIIIATCHNIHPHFTKKPLWPLAYETAYRHAEAFIHLGGYSRDLFEKKYPRAHHVIIAHHIYDDIYSGNFMPSREEALKKLRLSPDFTYILCAGAFRDESERRIVRLVGKKLNGKKVKILATGFKRKMLLDSPKAWVRLKSYGKYLSMRIKYPNVICRGSFVDDQDLPYYYAAADIALIQRIDILNSGNLPMALLMGKVVVGPDAGNVGLWLKELGNPTFDPKKLSTIQGAIAEAYQLAAKGKGEENHAYAMENLSTDAIAKQYINFYHNICSA